MRIFLTGATPAFNVQGTRSLEERFARTGQNTGNQLIAYGLLNVLASDHVSWNPELSAAEVNERFDHVAIAAANFLHSGFDFGYLADFLESIRLPVSIVGLGAQSSSFDVDIVLQPGTERFVSVLAERCKLIGVRGAYTADQLAKRGVANVQITGCPSYYAAVGAGLPQHLPALPGSPKIAVNASRDVIKHAFDPSAMQAAVAKLMRIAVTRGGDFVAQTEHAEMVIAEGYVNDLSPYLEELRDYFRDDLDTAQFDAWALAHCRVYWNVDNWLAAMREHDFIIGTRFHGAIAGLIAGTPAMVVCHDTRTTEMCRFLEVPHVGLSEFNAKPVEELYASIDLPLYHQRRSNLTVAYHQFLAKNGLAVRSAEIQVVG